MTDFYISAGSNIDAENNLLRGLSLLTERVSVLRVSTHYRSAPLQGRRQADYINGVWHGTTSLGPVRLKKVLSIIEDLCGRVRMGDSYASRTLDLDLILYGDRIIDRPELTLPDPEIKERAFIYVPLLELEPEIRLPGDSVRLSGLVEPGNELYYSPVTEILRNLPAATGKTKGEH